MTRFPPDFIDQVRSANDIVEVIGTVVQLKRSGSSVKGLSPFTKEKTASFYVNPDKQVFYCFSSGQGGDVIRFLMVYEGLKFSEAIERLAERAKLPLPAPERGGGRSSVERSDTKSFLLGIHEKVREFYHSLLMRSPAAAGAREYLKSRQIGSDTAKRFRLGYSPAGWDGLIKWAGTEKIPLLALEKLGLIVKGKGDRFYDRFRERLMIPIQDEQGRTVGFTARLLKKEAKEAKYVNSPETELFSKGKLLFGLDRAKRTIMERRTVIICEGQIDCITCQASGIENVVAPQGTAFTEYQARILKRHADEVVLCFDSDAAGRSATCRNALTLLNEGLRVKAVALPAGYDPDSFIKEKGPEAFAAIAAAAPGIFEWLQACFDWNNQGARTQGTKQIGELWRAIPDDVYKQHVLEQMQNLTGVPHPDLRRMFAAGTPPPKTGSFVRERKGGGIEETLLAYALVSEGTGSYILAHIEKDWLEDGFLKEWLLEILAKMETEGWEAACAIREDDPQAEEKQRVRARLFTSTLPQGNEALGHLKRCITTLQMRQLDAKIRVKQEEFRRTKDPSTRKEIQAQIHDFEKREDGLRKSLTSTPG